MTRHKTTPKYQRLAERFRKQILSGQLVPGDRLPSFAELRTHHGFTSITIEHAYRILEEENLIERRSGSGVYVTSQNQRPAYSIGIVTNASKDPSQISRNTHLLREGIRAASRQWDVGITFIELKDIVGKLSVDAILYHCDEFEAYSLGVSEDLPQAILFYHASNITSVSVDDFNAARRATAHLITHGHRRIACLQEEWMTIPIQRRMGYQVALREAGIEGKSAWMHLTPQIFTDNPYYYRDWGYEEMWKWLEAGWRDLGCTAIVAQNDESAIGIIQALREAEIRVPQDVSVIGFDGTGADDCPHLQLTSMEVPFYEIGKEAVKILLDQINNGLQTPHEVLLPVKLREGGTVASASVSVTQGEEK